MAWIPYTNKVEVCNAALGSLGLNLITDFQNDTSREAILCRNYWKAVTGECHAVYAWHFARKVVPLTLLNEAPFSNMRYGYLLPDDFSGRVIGVWPYKTEHDELLDKDIPVPDKRHRVEYSIQRQNILFTDDPKGEGGRKMIEYVSITEPNFWYPNFANFVVNELSIKLSPVGKQDDQDVYATKQKEMFLQKAIQEDNSLHYQDNHISFNESYHVPSLLR